MALLFCKWEPVSLRVLLAGPVPVHVVLDQWDVDFGEPDYELLGRAASLHHISDFNSLEEISAVAVDLRLKGAEIDRVASFAEFSQYGAGLLAQLLGVDDVSLDLAVAARDKREMKARLRRAGVPCARFVSIPEAASPPSPVTVSAELGFPVVVKPVSGMGAMSTVRIDRAEDFETTLRSLVFAPAIRSHQLMAEEYIEGPEFHADAVWRDGEPWHFTVGRYVRPRLSARPGEEGSVLLDPDEHSDLVAEAEKLHRAVNAALGVTSAATHLEFFQGPTGEFIASEIATRFGGGPLLDMVLARDGVDLRALWATELMGGERPETGPAKGRWSHVAGINIPALGDGVVTALPAEADLDADPHVLVHHVNCVEGEEIGTPWPLMLVLGAASEQELREVIERARSTYVIQTGSA